MGYREPSYDEYEDIGAQFEWDGDNERWLYRRNGRGAPVVVSLEEKERNEGIQQKGGVVQFAVFAAVFIFAEPLIELAYAVPDAEIRDLRLPVAMVIGLVILGLGGGLLNWISTRHFWNRPAVGPGRTRLDLWRMQVQRQSWLSLAWPPILFGTIASLHWPPASLGDWLMFVMAGLIVGFCLLLASLKREARRL